MALEFATPQGATPLAPDELAQLIPGHITSMDQLNEAEQLNIAAARIWALSRNRSDVLTAGFARALHKKMFEDVWRWAGTFRRRSVNIGNVDAYEIEIRLHQLFDDCAHWADEDVFPDDEIAARLHHGLTVVHAFPNGNGRHARLITDVFLKTRGGAPFSWGSGANLARAGEARDQYLEALRAADDHDIGPLIAFARS